MRNMSLAAAMPASTWRRFSAGHSASQTASAVSPTGRRLASTSRIAAARPGASRKLHGLQTWAQLGKPPRVTAARGRELAYMREVQGAYVSW